MFGVIIEYLKQVPRPIIRCQKGDGRRVAVKLAVDQPMTKKWVRHSISRRSISQPME